jgi:hypothetical protein
MLTNGSGIYDEDGVQATSSGGGNRTRLTVHGDCGGVRVSLTRVSLPQVHTDNTDDTDDVCTSSGVHILWNKFEI